jgi:pyruvate ferredoxin oxidoreductase gamma subunit
MYRIRFHGRGGEGIKTASRILGTSFFLEGFQVQDAPRYGAERRGAPVFAYVRADHKPIFERGPIYNPDLVVIADESLLIITPQTILEGITGNSVILIISAMSNEELSEIIKAGKQIISIHPDTLPENFRHFLSSLTASAAASLSGNITLNNIIQSIESELKNMSNNLLRENIEIAEYVFKKMEPYIGSVTESADRNITEFQSPDLITLPLKDSSIATPAIRIPLTSMKSLTGSWRKIRPVINTGICSKCMLCSVYCPDGVITAGQDGFPEIDYNYCKGCLICAEVCPVKAINKVEERLFRSKAI